MPSNLVTTSSPNFDVLLSRAVPVLTAEEAAAIIVSLQDEMRGLPNCVGLAAPQVGIPKAVAIVRHGGACLNLVNPSVVGGERPFIHRGEGCMSLPGRKFDVERFGTVRIRNHILWPSPAGTVAIGDDPNHRPLERGTVPKGMSLVPVEQVYVVENPAEDCGGIVAVAVQHEIDHLEGKTLDRSPAAKEVPSKDDPKWKVGRNDPCPCGSKRDDGSPKKFKQCCLPKIS